MNLETLEAFLRRTTNNKLSGLTFACLAKQAGLPLATECNKCRSLFVLTTKTMCVEDCFLHNTELFCPKCYEAIKKESEIVYETLLERLYRQIGSKLPFANLAMAAGQPLAFRCAGCTEECINTPETLCMVHSNNRYCLDCGKKKKPQPIAQEPEVVYETLKERFTRLYPDQPKATFADQAIRSNGLLAAKCADCAVAFIKTPETLYKKEADLAIFCKECGDKRIKQVKKTEGKSVVVAFDNDGCVVGVFPNSEIGAEKLSVRYDVKLNLQKRDGFEPDCAFWNDVVHFRFWKGGNYYV